jgi:hypothetical protein
VAYPHVLTHTPATDGYWDGQSMFADTVRTQQGADTLGCNRVDVVWTRATPTGTTEDKMQFRMFIAKIVGGGLYSVFPLSELAALETPLDAFTTTLKNRMPNSVTLDSYAWFEHRASHGATSSGQEAVPPAVRRALKTGAGVGVSDRMPDQVASTISWRTTARKHWGRSYVPAMGLSTVDGGYGRLTNIAVNAIAGAAQTLVNALIPLNGQLGVFTWKYGAFLPVVEIKVDDVYDIQRRRRAKRVGYFKSYTA